MVSLKRFVLHIVIYEVVTVKILEDRIVHDGVIKPGGVLKVDSFLNHQMDPALYTEIGKEFYRIFEADNVNKILTIEASGIGLALAAGQKFGCPVLFAKKGKSRNVSDDFYLSKVESFTYNKVYDVIVAKEFLTPVDRVLIIDDFLANGAALTALVDIVNQAGASVVGAGIAIEKAFQPGGELIRGQGIRIESLARIKSMDEVNGIEFC